MSVSSSIVNANSSVNNASVDLIVIDWSKVDFKIQFGPDGLPLANLDASNLTDLREHHIVLKDESHLDSFLNDMAIDVGDCFIPPRAVEAVENKNKLNGIFTHTRVCRHLISHEEACNLAHDPRVQSVELNPKDLGIEITTQSWSTTGTFSKAFPVTETDTSWGLARTLLANNIPNWGSGANTLTSTTIGSQLTGKNVDVCVLDASASLAETHEFAQNPDGTGYSRYVYKEWYDQYGFNADHPNGYPTYYMLCSPIKKYVDNNHNSHTSGTCAGNTMGFARDANIYGASILFDGIFLFTYFHNQKLINPITGVKNPTIVNNSWGYSFLGGTYFMTQISQVNYRGTAYYPNFKNSDGEYIWDFDLLASLKIPSQFGNGFPAQVASVDREFIDAAKAGVITVVSAGNSYFYIDTPDGLDYNNYIYLGEPGSGTVCYYNRGSSPGGAVDVTDNNSKKYSPISVGSYGAVQTGPMSSISTRILYNYPNRTSATGLLSEDYKSEFSNYGPGVDVFAPGEGIISVARAGNSAYMGGQNYSGNNVVDPRVANLSSTFKADTIQNRLMRDAGTSMSGPHVVGVLACILEENPTWTQVEAREWIKNNSKPSLISTSGGTDDATDAAINSSSSNYTGRANNLILNLPQTRYTASGLSSTPWPSPLSISNPNRSSLGPVYPRSKSKIKIPKTNVPSFSITANKTNISTPAGASLFMDGNDFDQPVYYGELWVDAATNTSNGFFGNGDWTFETYFNAYSICGGVLPINGNYANGFTDDPMTIFSQGLRNDNQQTRLVITTNSLHKGSPDYQGYVFKFEYNHRNSGTNNATSLVITPNKLSNYEWHHVALTYNSSTGMLSTFFDGTDITDLAKSYIGSWYSDSLPWLTFGRDMSIRPVIDMPNNQDNSTSCNGFTGFLSNTRICSGVRVYTGNFTVPSNPLQITQSSSTNISSITGNQCTLLTFSQYEAAGINCIDSSNFSSTNTLKQYVVKWNSIPNTLSQVPLSDISIDPDNAILPSTIMYKISPFGNSATISINATNITQTTIIEYIISGRPKSTSTTIYNGHLNRYHLSVPMTGKITVIPGHTTTFPITFYTTDSYWINFRLNYYGSPDITFSVN